MSAPIMDALEPSAVEAKERCAGLPIEEVAALSIAASVKRIADAISGGSIDLTVIGNQIETIAWNAGRAFESGRRQ
jgi:hypothetical protein